MAAGFFGQFMSLIMKDFVCFNAIFKEVETCHKSVVPLIKLTFKVPHDDIEVTINSHFKNSHILTNCNFLVDSSNLKTFGEK